jgi:hypothetical protein
MSGELHAPVVLKPRRSQWIGGWVALRVDTDVMVRGGESMPLGEIEPWTTKEQGKKYIECLHHVGNCIVQRTVITLKCTPSIPGSAFCVVSQGETFSTLKIVPVPVPVPILRDDKQLRYM